MALRFCEYGASAHQANVVVDGSPNAGTVLTLTHWPGIAQPPGLGADLSAEMAFRFLRTGDEPGAEFVTNNHFDQDGLVAMVALIDPETALRHEALLTDVAAAGDFSTYRFREAARASMAIWTYADGHRSPIASQLTGSYPEQCAVLYDTLLDLVIAIADDPMRHRELWADEDAQLTATEDALASGRITIEEHPGVDLAVVRIAADEPERTGHRFASETFAGAHPMAINNATSRMRLLQVHGGSYRYTDRYETWVQYRSRRLLPRVDVRPLAAELTAAEHRGATWTASPPSALTPAMTVTDESSLDADVVIRHLTRHLVAAPPAWDPYAIDA